MPATAFAEETSGTSKPTTSNQQAEQQQAKHWRAAVTAAQKFDYATAVANVDVAEQAGLTEPIVFYHRGRWNFCDGKIQASLADFDRYVAAVPKLANSQWERGITCYYAKQYKGGAQQFVDYQNYHDNDVENAIWRYLCQMKFDGKQKARAAILPIKNDTRVPMMEIYRLFRGESTPEKVLQALDQSAPATVKQQQAFDAHLYLALFFESEYELAAARKHIDLAVQQQLQGDYMWAVAVEHQKLRKRQQGENKDLGENGKLRENKEQRENVQQRANP